MKRLCEAATSCGEKKGNVQISYKAVESALLQISEELSTVEEHRTQLFHLYTKLSHLPDVVKGKLVLNIISCQLGVRIWYLVVCKLGSPK